MEVRVRREMATDVMVEHDDMPDGDTVIFLSPDLLPPKVMCELAVALTLASALQWSQIRRKFNPGR